MLHLTTAVSGKLEFYVRPEQKPDYLITQLKNLSPHECANDTGNMFGLVHALTVQAITNLAY